MTSKDYAQALVLALEETRPEDHETIITNLTEVLKANNDLDLFESIIAEVEIELASRAAEHTASVTFGTNAASNENIIRELNKAVPNLQVRSLVDDQLVGGVVIRVDDSLVDASVKTQLTNIEQTLQE